MSHLENDLRDALSREEPSPDFADRVTAALPSHPSTVVLMPARPKPNRLWLAVAAALVIGAGTLWIVAVAMRSPVDVVSGVTNAGSPGPRAPIFEGGGERPAPKADASPIVGDTTPQPKAHHPAKVRRVSHIRPSPTNPARREQDAQAFLAARQLRLALTITSEKLRVAQRGVADRSELPTG